MDARLIEADVAVVGAGVAGLAARDAWSPRAGRRRPRSARPCRRPALEHGDRRRGERARRRVGRAVSVAPARAARELGIELFPAYRDGDDVYVDESGRAHRHPGDEHGLSSADERALKEADAKLDALAKELDPEAPWEHPERASSTPSPSTSGFAPRSATRPRARTSAPTSPTASSTKPAHSFSLLQGLWVIAGAGGTYELFAAEQCLAYRVVGGSQLIPLRLAEQLGDRVVLDAPVRAISWSDGGVEIDAGHARSPRAPRSSPLRRTSPLRFASIQRCPPGGCGFSRRSRRGASPSSSPSTTIRSGARTGSRARDSRRTSSCASSTTTRLRRPRSACCAPSFRASRPSAAA